jgi:fumarate reductase flavoprotein subunit
MKQADTRKAALLFAQTLFIMTFVAGCKTPTDSEEPYVLHFTPGTYEASATGYNQTTPIRARVTFSEDAIEIIEIVSHEEGVIAAVRDRYNAHEGQTLDEDMLHNSVQATLDLIPEAIKREQTLALDAVSGATARWTREGILKAVEDCVRQAGGDEAVAKLKEGGIAKSIAMMYSGK